MTETKTDPTADEIAAAEEARVNALAVGTIKAQAADVNLALRMVDDTYVGIVGTARRYNAGEGSLEAVQAELDRVFGKGKVDAADVTTPQPEVEPPAATATSSKSK